MTIYIKPLRYLTKKKMAACPFVYLQADQNILEGLMEKKTSESFASLFEINHNEKVL